MFPAVPLPNRPGPSRFPVAWCFACGIGIAIICLLHAEPRRKPVVLAAPPAAAIPFAPHNFIAGAAAVRIICEVERCGPELRSPVVPRTAQSAKRPAAPGKIFHIADADSAHPRQAALFPVRPE